MEGWGWGGWRGIAIFMKVNMIFLSMLPLHMWFPNLRSSSLHRRLMKLKTGEGEKSINYARVVKWCLAVSTF